MKDISFVDLADLPDELTLETAAKVFSKYAGPMIHFLKAEGHWHKLEEHEAELMLPVEVWNAIIRNDDMDDPDDLAHIRKKCSLGQQPYCQPLINFFIDSKRGPFEKYKCFFRIDEISKNDEGEPVLGLRVGLLNAIAPDRSQWN